MKINLNQKKVLITGSDGFIGSHLVERFLDLNCEVNAFVFYNPFNSWGWLDSLNNEVRDKIKVFSGDIRDYGFVKNAVKDIDIICHLAALIGIPYSYIAPKSYIDTNLIGTFNILQSAKEYNVKKVIITSTSEVYGSAKYVPIDEKHPYQPQSPYSASKIAADQLALSYFYSFNLPITIIRPFNNYGPRQSTRAVIPTIITQIIKQNRVLELGNLDSTRDFTFVLDTCDAYIKVCQTSNLEGEIINIGNGSEISIYNLAKKIAYLMDREIFIKSTDNRRRPPKSEVNRLFAGIEKANKLLRWKPKYDLDEGLSLTVKWFKNTKNLEKYKLGYTI